MRLGIEFIWIDSMCILQDSPEDWAEEACKMSTVYSKAIVTIIASSASHCNAGFLALPKRSISLGTVGSGDKRTEIRAGEVMEYGHHHRGRKSHDWSDIEDVDRWLDPVELRAWTLQEKLLSPRYINFTSGEVQWWCPTAQTCECGHPAVAEAPRLSSSEDDWFNLVTEYTDRYLTVVTDRLPALAGIVRILTPQLDHTYVSGIWISSRPEPTSLTVRGLLWHWLPQELYAMYCPEERAAPSFSWASVVGPVMHYRLDSSAPVRYVARILETGEGPFGRVAGGFLRIQGCLLRARLAYGEGRPDEQTLLRYESWGLVDEHVNYDVTCDVDGMLDKVALAAGGSRVTRHRAPSIGEAVRFSHHHRLEPTNVFVLPLMLYCTKAGGYRGLLLARSPTLPGYERIGVATVWGEKLPSVIEMTDEVTIY